MKVEKMQEWNDFPQRMSAMAENLSLHANYGIKCDSDM